MHKNSILRLALPTPLRRLFDYLPPDSVPSQQLTPGIRIKVPFQSRTLVGILIEIVQESSVPYQKLKAALAILDDASIFSPDIYQLCHWASDYYHCSLGEVLTNALPSSLRKGKLPISFDNNFLSPISSRDTQPQLNASQQHAITTICAEKNNFKTFLLDGVTGSGKTEIYLQVMAELLQDGKQILVLVPEINLTPQTIARFRARFQLPIAALHSNLSESERLQAWLAAQSGNIRIVIGTRSTIFTPFKNLGLIIVDEEHDSSFKQQDRFRYHARDLAVMRARLNNIPIILGSATPSLESLLNAKRNRYEHLLLPKRAGNAQLPNVQIINLHTSPTKEGLSTPLLQTMQDHLHQNNQVMLFLNRRGFAPVMYCTQCQHIINCHRCDARMVYHHSPQRLHCHYCDAKRIIPTSCEKCNENSLLPIGVGTQKLEQKLIETFPDVPIIRIDKDSTKRKGTMQNLLDKIHSHPKAILLGTQMLAKGHHFPQVTLVGIIDADGGLFSADFRATEQMGQLLTQVAGRAGRAEKPGVVLVQTHHPEHSLLQTLTKGNYSQFAHTLLTEREQGYLPPFAHFAVFRAEAPIEENVIHFLLHIKTLSIDIPTINMLGPVSALLSKRKGLFRKHLLIRAAKRQALQTFLKQLIQQIENFGKSYPVKWTLDVDPVEII
ncbi:MAG: hypothetical protein A3F13_07380 [Gammaproteobacteria bacterium RIFCSPHIGHO2_12_FULL_40_19]|nr:MAG: hypothetical protein A3F13_07380 [Gammaproteobacteria bacterium RIFCSPHIGHO2_12_FULL_40_19]